MTKPTQPSDSPSTAGPYTPVFTLNRPVLCCATVRDFVVVGGTPGSTAGVGDPRVAVRWCAIGDPTDWPTPATDEARAKQSGEQVFPTKYGFVTAIAGNDFFAYVFQEKAITKMTYVGGDVVFTFDTFEEDRGCITMGRVTQIDDKVFFQSGKGYHVLEDGIIADLGYGIVDDTYV